MHFITLKIFQILLGILILVFTFTTSGSFWGFGGIRDPHSGFIIDPESPERTKDGVILWNGDLRPIVAANKVEMVLLGLSRFSAFFMYPALVMAFVTKFRATGAFISLSPLSMFLIEDVHRLHIYCGYIILFDAIIHSAAHISRWVIQGNIRLLIEHRTGISGIVAFISVLLIVLPMASIMKRCIRYEIRKGFHYLFLVMIIALGAHSSPLSIPNGGFSYHVFGVLLVWYSVDALYCTFFMTEVVETTEYQTLLTGVQITLKVSRRFQNWRKTGGYAYVCFPWFDRYEWHAFSLFENPCKPEERQIFMQTGGDWTSQVHEQLQRSSVRPVWIQGPFPSPYSSSIQYDNLILVAAGIGITPALSVLRAHRNTRRINLIWSVRDAAMLLFFLEKAYLDNRGWNLIFYTGTTPLANPLIKELTNTNTCIIQARANLATVIPNIIYGIESKRGLPETYILDRKNSVTDILSVYGDELDRDPSLSMADKLNQVRNLAKELGYSLPDVIDSQKLGQLHRIGLSETGEGDDEAQNQDNIEAANSDRPAGSQSRPNSLNQPLLEGVPKDSLVIQKRIPNFGYFCQNKSALRQKLEAIAGEIKVDFAPWEPIEEADPHVKGLDKKVLATWGILYCGGKGALFQSLKTVAKKCKVNLHSESFNW